MLKRILIRALNRFLGSYIENIDKHQLELGVFRGCISVRNLRIKPSVISRMFEGRVVFNNVGSLQVLIPWRSFNRRPIEIHIKDVSIRLGRAGFCWCFAGSELCAGCIEGRKYELMNKIDKLNLLAEALSSRGDVGFFPDFVRGGSFRLLVEDISIEYVSGVCSVLRVKEIGFNREGLERKDGVRLLDVVGVEVASGSNVLGPFDVCAEVEASGRSVDGGRIDVHVGEICGRMEQTAIEEMIVGFEEYNMDRVRWMLLRSHEIYGDLLRFTRGRNVWRDTNDDVDSSDEVVGCVWRYLVLLQRRIIECSGVLVEDVAKVMAQTNRYKDILRKAKPSVHEIEEREKLEEEMPLKRLLSVRKSVLPVSKGRSWREVLLFGHDRNQHGNRRSLEVSLRISMGRLVVSFTSKEHHGFKMDVRGGRFKFRDMLSPSGCFFDFSSCRIYYVSTSVDKNNPREKEVSCVCNVKGTFVRDALKMEVKGRVEECRLFDGQGKLLHCLEDLSTVLADAYFPGLRPLPSGGKTRMEFKVDVLVMPVKLGTCPDGQAGEMYIVAREASSSYLRDPVNKRTVASLVVPSFMVYSNTVLDAPISNSIEVSAILIDGVFYIKTSKMDLYAYGLWLDKLRGDGTVFPLGFTVPRFEICSDAIKLSREERSLELRRFKATGSGGTVLRLEVYKAKMTGRGNKTMCSVPKLKAEVRFGKVPFLDIHECRVKAGMKRVMRILHGIFPGAAEGSIPCLNVGIRRLQAVIKDKDTMFDINVCGYSKEMVREVRVGFLSNAIEIRDLEMGEKYGCGAVDIWMTNGEIAHIMSLVENVSTIVGGDPSQDLEISVMALHLRLMGVEMWGENLRLSLKQGGVRFLQRFSLRMCGMDGEGVLERDDGDNTVVVDVSSLCVSDNRVSVEGGTSGRLDERLAVGVCNVLRTVWRCPSTSSSMSVEHHVCLALSLELLIEHRLFRFSSTLKVDGEMREGLAIVLVEPVFESDDGEHIGSSGVDMLVSSEKICISARRMLVDFGLHRFVRSVCSLTGCFGNSPGEDSGDYADGNSGMELSINMDEIVLRNKGHDEVRARDMRYGSDLRLYCTVGKAGRENLVIYESISTRTNSRRLLSVLGGSCDLDAVVNVLGFYVSEYFGVCEELGLVMSEESFDVLLVNVEGMVRNGPVILRPCVLVGHFSVQSSSVFCGRLLCSLGIYNRGTMEFEPTVEETVVEVRKGGILLTFKMLDQVRILCSHNLVHELRKYFDASTPPNDCLPLRPLYVEVTLKNLTNTGLSVDSTHSSMLVGGGMSVHLEVKCEGHVVFMGIGDTRFPINIGGSGRYHFEAGTQDFIVLVCVDGGNRTVTVLHPLVLLNQCNMRLGVRICCLNMAAMSLDLEYNTPCTVPVRHAFVLEIGTDGGYTRAGRIDVDSLVSSSGVDMKESLRCKLPGGGIDIWIDMVALCIGSVYSTTMVLYPSFEVANSMGLRLNLMLYAGEEAVEHAGRGEVTTCNTPFSVETGCREDVYSCGDEEIRQLGLCNLSSGSKTRLSKKSPRILITSRLSGVVKLENCEIDMLFGRHVLMHKTRVLVHPSMVFVNALDKEMYIDTLKLGVGMTFTNRVESARSLSVGDYWLEEHMEFRDGGTRTITLVNRKCSAMDIVNASKTHMGLEWSKETIFGRETRQEPCICFIRLAMSVQEDMGSTVVKFSHAFLVRNRTRERLLIVAERISLCIDPCSTSPLCFMTSGFHLFVDGHVDMDDLRGSGVFVPSSIPTTGYFSLCRPETRVFGVWRSDSDGQCVFTIEEEESWPYIICNETTRDLEFYQEHGVVRHVVRRRSSLGYALDSLLLDPTISVRLGDESVLLFLNRDGVVRMFGHVISISQMDRTRLVQISCGDATPVEERRQYFNVLAEECLVSLVDEDNVELVCGGVRGLEITMEHRRDKRHIPGLENLLLEQTASLHTSWTHSEWGVTVILDGIQIDDQNILCVFPVVLYPVDRHQRMCCERTSAHKFVVLDFALNVSAHHISVSNLYCRVQDFVLNVEERLIKKIWRIMDLGRGGKGDGGVCSSRGRNLRIQNLKIERMKMRINLLKDLESDFFSNVVGFFINNISDFSIEMDGLRETDLYTTVEDCVDMFSSFYLAQFKKNLYKAITHLDFIGNVGCFAESVSTGVRELFSEPVSGTGSMTLGFIRGGKSLLRNTIYGVSNTIGKVSKSISTSASLATLDGGFRPTAAHHPYINDGTLLVPCSERPRGPIRVLARSTGNLLDSIASGIAGIAASPMEGASRGVAGFLKGVGKGMLGAFAKPIVGVADLVTDVSDTIKLSVDSRQPVRIQYPRPRGHRLGGYDDGLSQGFYIFEVLIRKYPEEVFVDGTFGDFNGRCQVILTNRRLLISNTVSILEVLMGDVSVRDRSMPGFSIDSCDICVTRLSFIDSLSMQISLSRTGH